MHMSSVGLVRGTLADADAQRITSATFAVPRQADRPSLPTFPPEEMQNDGDFSYLFHKATPTGLSHVRMNGTIWNGATQIGSTTVRSNTFNYTGPLFPLDPCHNNLTWTPVRSLSDPGYNPLRVTDPEGGDLVVPDSGLGIVGTMSKIDRTFDANNMNQTMGLVNAQTGFSAGAQTIISRITGQLSLVYDISHITLDPGPWQRKQANLWPTGYCCQRHLGLLTQQSVIIRVSAPIDGTTSLANLADIVGAIDVQLTEEEVESAPFS
ncbi:hypothetical protein DFH09DRAFT_1302084 [Mycena vulgaris]|nr:hypothetical protein DFH09DRAFT_1302084 [Mycena vulgaris]